LPQFEVRPRRAHGTWRAHLPCTPTSRSHAPCWQSVPVCALGTNRPCGRLMPVRRDFSVAMEPVRAFLPIPTRPVLSSLSTTGRVFASDLQIGPKDNALAPSHRLFKGSERDTANTPKNGMLSRRRLPGSLRNANSPGRFAPFNKEGESLSRSPATSPVSVFALRLPTALQPGPGILTWFSVASRRAVIPRPKDPP
jgi:hypothetical protein